MVENGDGSKSKVRPGDRVIHKQHKQNKRFKVLRKCLGRCKTFATSLRTPFLK